MVELTIASEDGETDVLRATAEHPIWVQSRGWVEAERIVPDDELQAYDGRALRVTEVRRTDLDLPVYNIQVDEIHTYFVGALGAWAHNKPMANPGKTVSRVWPKHHPFPKYLGGAAEQSLRKIPKRLHYRFHAALDKWKGGKYARNKGAAHFRKMDRETIIQDLREFYRDAEGGIFR